MGHRRKKYKYLKYVKRCLTSLIREYNFILQGDTGMVAVVHNTVVHICQLLRVDLKSSHHKQSFFVNYVRD